MINTGRERDAKIIRRANRAAAVGRLLLRQINSWEDFLAADTINYEKLPRRQLKAGVADIKSRLGLEIKRFCSKNFIGMSEDKLSLLYEEINASRGLEMPLFEFEQKYAQIKREVIKGNPNHLTVCLSLWGLQFKFPEDEISKDIIQALDIVSKTKHELDHYKQISHIDIEEDRINIGTIITQNHFGSRSTLLSCFNLMEAYLNGLAWDYINKNGTKDLSNNQRKLLEDSTSVSIRDKLMKYPSVLSGKELWHPKDEELESFISVLKPYRDSLVHPSPFSAPERFGGYDKLRLLYRVDSSTAFLAAKLLVTLIKRIHMHIFIESKSLPEWLDQLNAKIDAI